MNKFRSFLDVWLTRFRYPLGAVFAWLSTIIGLLAGGIEISAAITGSHTVREWALSLTLCLIAITCLFVLGYREFYRLGRIRLARTLPYLDALSTSLRDLRSYLNLHSARIRTGQPLQEDVLERSREMLSDILSKEASIFTTMTATSCRACVKLIDVVQPSGSEKLTPNDIFVFALARDSSAAMANRTHDKKRADEKFDRLAENSDFLKLYDENVDDPGFFLSNDLIAEEDYETSSIKYWNNYGQSAIRSTKVPWKLPYQSAIVWPIRQDPRPSLGINEYRTIGFLAVDSHAKNAFSRELHVPIGAILANALFPILEIYRDLAEAQVEAKWQKSKQRAAAIPSAKLKRRVTKRAT
jgi:hypothetical protein